MLTPIQRDQYQTFGCVILRNYLSVAEVGRLQAESRRELAWQFRHKPFDGTRRHFTCMNQDHRTPFAAGLLQDERFLGVADQLLGRALPMWCDANRYTDPLTGWHPDCVDQEWSWQLPAAKFCIYLQPLRADSGALRVIPGSHHRPLHDQVRVFLGEHQVRVAEVPALVCDTDPGDVILFQTALWHASDGGGRDRGLNTLAYYTAPTTPLQRAGLQRALADQVPQIRSDLGWLGEVFPQHWLDAAAADARRRLVVERIQEAGVIAAVSSGASVC